LKAPPHNLGDCESLRAAFNCAGTSNDGQLVTADGRVAHAHDCLFLAHVERHQFIWLADANSFGDAGKSFEM